MRVLRGVLSCILLAAASEAAAAEASPPPPPTSLQVFTRHDHIVDARISPGGSYLAAVTMDGGRRGLAIVDLAHHKLSHFFRPEGTTGVGDVHWVSDDRLVIELVEMVGDLAAPGSRGEIYSLGADGKGGHMIFGYRAGELQVGTRLRKGERELAWGFVLGALRGDPRHVVVQSTSWEEVGDRVVSLYKVDVITGVKDLVVRSPMKGAGFLVDEEGEPRLATAPDAELRAHWFFRDKGGGWNELTELKGIRPGSTPVGFASRTRTLYVEEQDARGFTVLSVDLGSGERKPLAHDALAPPSGFAFDAAHRLVAVEFQPDLPVLQFVEPDHPLARALRGLQASFPDEHVRLVDATADEAKMVVRVYSDRDPGRFLLVDVKTMTADPVGEVRPWVKPEELAEMSAFHIPAGDGFRIHGYVTLPRAPSAQPPPMVVMPHGGPNFVRDTWQYDPTARLLASQGFAVLQVNYRGSGGYGLPYQEAGYRHWGDRIIEDIADATRFAIRKGWADPKRIAVFGASFGGYAALQSTIVAPDLYRCAVGYAGVYDLKDMPNRDEVVTSRLARGYYRKAVGDAPEDLAAASPVNHADRIAVPVMLIHGEQDQRAPFEQAKRMRKALTDQGRPPEWLAEPREGHGFYDEGARERMAAALLRFLQDCTRGAAAPAEAGKVP